MTLVREAAVAGSFYPADPGTLQTTIETLLDAVDAASGKAPKALIVPHAGYRYSGPVAASAYARLRPYRELYSRVLLLGPSHRVPMRDVAASSAHVFRTPLGDVELDRAATAAVPREALRVLDLAHEREHSLEVHLPFLQVVLGPFTLLPLVVGDAPVELVADLIESLWGGRETLIVVSSDLSHYLDYENARTVDRATCRAVEGLESGAIGHDGACGATPLGGLLLAAKRRGLRVTTLDLRNSGDTAGDRHSVVGYGAWMLRE